MSLPKEPRQKMINMMYLVLTALLALNVSAEILNAFKTVNNSIKNANGVIDTKNKTSFSSFDELAKDPKTAEKAATWQPLALNAKKLSDDVNGYIDGLKTELVKISGTVVENGVEEMNPSNLDAASNIFDTQKKGEELHDKLEGFKKQLLGILDPSKFTDPAIKKTVAEKRAEFEKTLPLDLSVPASQTGSSNKDWSSAYFHMTPSIAAMTILSKFQNDVKNSEAQVVDFCLQQVGSVKVIFDKFQPLIGTNSTYLMPGQELEVTAGIGAYSSAARPSISIGGANVPLGADGSALYKTKVSGAGERSVDVKISYVKPDGTTDVINKTIKYTVGIPSGASAFLEKMNVMYLGVDNPVLISAGSAGAEKMQVSFTGGSISKTGGDRFIAVPKQVGPAELKITVEGKTTAIPIRCKILPDPIALVGGKKGGPIGAAEFKVQGGIIAKLLDSDFEAPFQVLSYKVGANGGNISVYREVPNEGARWGSGADALIKQAGPGSSIFFDQIRVKGPDGKVRELPGIYFNLR